MIEFIGLLLGGFIGFGCLLCWVFNLPKDERNMFLAFIAGLILIGWIASDLPCSFAVSELFALPAGFGLRYCIYGDRL